MGIANVRTGIMPGGRRASNYARMCVSKSEGQGSFFGLKGVKWVRIFHSKWVYNVLGHSKGVRIYVE